MWPLATCNKFVKEFVIGKYIPRHTSWHEMMGETYFIIWLWFFFGVDRLPLNVNLFVVKPSNCFCAFQLITLSEWLHLLRMSTYDHKLHDINFILCFWFVATNLNGAISFRIAEQALCDHSASNQMKRATTTTTTQKRKKWKKFCIIRIYVENEERWLWCGSWNWSIYLCTNKMSYILLTLCNCALCVRIEVLFRKWM